jgi:hypothetical protein
MSKKTFAKKFTSFNIKNYVVKNKKLILFFKFGQTFWPRSGKKPQQ